MSTFNKLCERLARHHLVIVQSAQAGCLMTVGDLLAQKFVEKKSEIDVMRTMRFGALGCFLVGPAVASWYKFLSIAISDKDKTAAVKKVVLDQFVFAPSFMPIFLVALNTLKGHNLETTKAELHDKYVDIMLANYKLWPLVQFINFKFMPLKYQVVMNQSVGIFWNCYLAWKTQKAIKQK